MAIDVYVDWQYQEIISKHVYRMKIENRARILFDDPDVLTDYAAWLDCNPTTISTDELWDYCLQLAEEDLSQFEIYELDL